MMGKLQILDCTLRDGGHLNEGKFGEQVIRYTIQKLIWSHIEIIEVGFLWDEPCDKDTTHYYSIKDVKRILPENRGNSKFALMADGVALEKIEPYDGTIDYIRLSFKRNRFEWAILAAYQLKEKGYKVFINPVNCNVYSDEDYLRLIKRVNEIKPYGFTIVDTFGVMRLADLSAKYYLVENNLDKDIVIGLHLHENLGLSYSLAQHFINIRNPMRDIVIDGSLFGMGRAPGNLPIEQIMDHLNSCCGTNYLLEPVYDAIDDYIEPIKKERPWGYAVPYAISARCHLHRTYAEYLIKKWKLKTSDIQNILSKVAPEKAELFDEEYIEQIYRKYLDVYVDDSAAVEELKKLWRKMKLVIAAPGSSLLLVKDKLRELKKEKKVAIICINFIPEFLVPDYVFFSNIKRYETESMKLASLSKIILTSNLMESTSKYDYVFKYGTCALHNGTYNEDSVLMMLNVLKRMGRKDVLIAGFDGFIDYDENFYSKLFDRQLEGEYKNAEVARILNSVYTDITLQYLTPSFYEKSNSFFRDGAREY